MGCCVRADGTCYPTPAEPGPVFCLCCIFACRDDERIEYYHLISMKHVGDTLNLKILRDGQVRGCVCVWGGGGV